MVAEGAGQDLLGQSGDQDASGNEKLADIGHFLRDAIGAHFKAAGIEIIRSEINHRTIVEAIDDSIYLVDKNCRYLFMNTYHQHRLGITDGNYEGRDYADFHTPAETERFARSVKESIEKLFLEAKADVTRAHVLKAELDKWNVYKEYEDRFLDLFKKKPEKGN